MRRVDHVIPPDAETLARIMRDPAWPRRSGYAREVLFGRALLSGADIRSRWTSGYARMRARVEGVARRYGVIGVYSQPHGRRVWHVPG